MNKRYPRNLEERLEKILDQKPRSEDVAKTAREMFCQGEIRWLPLLKRFYNAVYFPDEKQTQPYDEVVEILERLRIVAPCNQSRAFSLFRGEANCLRLFSQPERSFALDNKFEASKLFLECWYYLQRHGCPISEISLRVYNQERDRWVEIPPTPIPVRKGYNPHFFLGLATVLEENSCAH